MCPIISIDKIFNIPLGTKLYKIKGINEGAAIAVELEKDIYIKAYNKKSRGFRDSYTATQINFR